MTTLSSIGKNIIQSRLLDRGVVIDTADLDNYIIDTNSFTDNNSMYNFIIADIINKQQTTNAIQIDNTINIVNNNIKEETKQTKKSSRPATCNNVKELNKLIKYAKREILEQINKKYDRADIYKTYEFIKDKCKKYNKANKTCEQIYYKFLNWWDKHDKVLFPEFH